MAAMACLILLMGKPSLGAETTDPSSRSEETWEQKFIRGDILITQWLDSTAEGIDLFLSGKKVSNRKNRSNVRIENSTLSVGGDNLRNSTSLGVNLRLPNLEEYWQLKFTSYDESEEKRGVQNGYLRSTPRDNKYGASLGFFRNLNNIRITFQPQVELSDPLKISHSLAFESVAEFRGYVVNPKLEFFATPDKGTGIYLAGNVNLGLSNMWSLTFINYGRYEDKGHIFSTGNGLSFGQSINAKTSFVYSWLFFSNNRDNYHLDGYSLSVAWNHVLYRRILDVQLIPHLDFTREHSFIGYPGIILNFILNF